MCRFDFAAVYGEGGLGFAEGHHTLPMAQAKRKRISRLEDIAIVCANCHRMLHRPPFHSVESLLTLVESRRQPGSTH